MKFEMSPEGPKMIPVVGELSEEQKKLSAELKAEFPAYVNALGLKDENGEELTLEENGEGTFKDYVMSFVAASAQKEKETHDSKVRLLDLAVPGSDIEKQGYITFEENQVKKIDADAYVKKITRMKPTPAFDALSLESPEMKNSVMMK